MKKLFLCFAILIFSPGSVLAQPTASEAMDFLRENIKSHSYIGPKKKDDIGLLSKSRIVEINCNRVSIEHTTTISGVGTEPVTNVDVNYFDPRDVYITDQERSSRDIWFKCVSGECINGGPGRRFQFETSQILVEYSRIKKAWDEFQQSCGGPKKSAF